MTPSDSGWKCQNLGRCYNRYTRVITFEKETPQSFIDSIITSVRSKMYGQSQNVSSKNEGGQITVTFTDTVDSGD